MYPTESTRSKNTMQNLKWHHVPTTDIPRLGKSPRKCQRSPLIEPKTNVSIQVATGVSPRTSPETKAGTKVMRSILAAGSQGSCVVTTSTSNFKLISWTTYYGSDRGYRDSFEIFKFQTQVKKHGQSTVGRDGKQHELRINRTNCESNFRSNFCGNNTL